MNLHEEIAKVAYELYEKSGRIEGRDLDNWLEAEKIVMQRLSEQGSSEECLTESTTVEEIPVEPFPKVTEKPKRTAKKTSTVKKAEKKTTTTKKTTRKKKSE